MQEPGHWSPLQYRYYRDKACFLCRERGLCSGRLDDGEGERSEVGRWRKIETGKEVEIEKLGGLSSCILNSIHCTECVLFLLFFYFTAWPIK